MNENVWPLILLGGGLLAFLLAVSFCLLYTSPSPRDCS